MHVGSLLSMKNIIPITDFQRSAAKILNDVQKSSEPIVITQRGRASAVLLSAERYAEIEKYLEDFDETEMMYLVEQGERDKAAGNTISLEEAKKRLGYPG